MEFFRQVMDTSLFVWVILPILIFLSKILDVSLGTIRIIFVSRGKKLLAPLLGFIEVLIWLIAISQIMQNIDNALCLIAYAGGYATGNYVGIFIEEKLAIGTQIIRIFLVNDEAGMKEKLYSAGFGVTSINAQGMNGEVKIIFTVIKRKDMKKAVEIIKGCDSKAFYSIEDAKSVKQGIFPSRKRQTDIPFKVTGKRHFAKHGK